MGTQGTGCRKFSQKEKPRNGVFSHISPVLEKKPTVMKVWVQRARAGQEPQVAMQRQIPTRKRSELLCLRDSS